MHTIRTFDDLFIDPRPILLLLFFLFFIHNVYVIIHDAKETLRCQEKKLISISFDAKKKKRKIKIKDKIKKKKEDVEFFVKNNFEELSWI